MRALKGIVIKLKNRNMTFEIKIKMEVEGNKISVQSTLPFDANAQCILNALEETHRVILGMLKKERKADRAEMTVKDLYEKQELVQPE
jgi:hypothetical protein